ncbi:MAG: glycosyltransferase [Marinibacterium sp.]|nr:glycosyltransferase [Marinibacterium sp.]
MRQKRIVIVTPVFEDWKSFRILVAEINKMAHLSKVNVRVLAVDDGSVSAPEYECLAAPNVTEVQIVRLACNLGHQRAIAIGLVEAFKLDDIDGVIVMDCDGEDRVQDIPHVLGNAAGDSITVVTRATRSEGLGFRIFYVIYKLLFKLMTGSSIDFGNFMYIPKAYLSPLVHFAGIWNHLAASVQRSRLPISRQACPRGQRYAGQSKMNFPSLVVHGLGAISVYLDVVLARLLIALLLLIGGLIATVGAVVVIRFATDLAIAGWATTAIGLLAVVLFQSFSLIFIGVFQVLNQRSVRTVIPAQEAGSYIQSQYAMRIEETGHD